MLSVDEFSVGTLSQAQALTYVLPRSSHEKPILVAPDVGVPVAIFLGADEDFLSFGSSDNTYWGGLLIHGVRIEVDETSVFNPEGWSPPLGAVLRKDKILCVVTKSDDRFKRQRQVVLADGLGQVEPREAAGFMRWQVVLGQRADKRVLHRVDVSSAKR